MAGNVKYAKRLSDMKPVETAFERTSALLLGKPLPGGIDRYSGWLTRHNRKWEKHKSVLSGRQVSRVDYCGYFELPPGKLITAEEARFIGDNVAISQHEAESISLASAPAPIGKIAFFVPEYEEGMNVNVPGCPNATDSANCYRASPIVYSKFCAYSFWPRSSEYAFGCEALFDSAFCMNAHYSSKIRAGFEIDSCRDCSNLYFSHNCENVQDSMFCFNVKNRQYAIGNAP